MLAGTARTLLILTSVLVLALLVNGFFLFEAFRASSAGAHYRIVIKSDAEQNAQAISGELRGITGVTVESQESKRSRRKLTGRYWLGRELEPDEGRQMLTDLTGLHHHALSEPAGEGHVVVRLAEDFPTESGAVKARNKVNAQLQVMSLNVIPAFKMEYFQEVVMDVTVAEPNEFKTVQQVAGKHDLSLQPVAGP